MKQWLIALAAVLLATTAVAREGGVEDLARYFESVDTLQGRFVQETRDETGELVEKAEGHFVIDRPGRFNWVYETPYAQRIVADGEWLWVHDRDLLQVTVRPVDEVLGVGPALMLSGDFRTLRDRFRIESGEDGWLRLTPTDEQWDFQAARLRLDDGVPVEVALDDGLGQTVRLELQSVVRNEPPPADSFDTEVPDGVDLIAPPEYSGGS
ncbi:outer membrane lipoprotein chaperone LolA [Arhodomonas sp. AD133]|uniref:outer membrane lipoprotein chaperone LolA n=1 Tax=Arhodomonas sp. AD133 TaxID=3415009 RepID=UPI003EBF36A8